MITLEARAEQVRLARTLGVEPSELAFLMDAPEGDLRLLRERVSDELFATDRRHFEGMIKLARRLPAPLNATLAQRALGPRLSAGAANVLPPEMTVDMVKRLPAPFLADIAVHADARRLAPLLGKVPPATIAEITRLLAQRQEWVAMGAFVSHLNAKGLEAAIAVLDAEALLRTGFVIEDKAKVIDPTVRLLSDPRLNEYAQQAVALDLIPEALDLAGHLTRRQLKRLAQSLASLSDAQLEELVTRVRAEPVLEAAAAELLDVAPLRVRAAAGL
ncbi:MAG: hypothetical protein WKF94_02125 [Solirubrobacteraceae bacterium]